MLLGRRSECETLDRLLEAVRAGESRALVVRGEPGVGKTALLEYVARAGVGLPGGAGGGRAVRDGAGVRRAASAVRADAGPARAASGSRSAMRSGTAFGLSAGDAPDRFLVGLAVLSLLAEVAEERPLVCVVDDAQWLDRASAQALAFVARRLRAESVAMVFAVREPARTQELAGLPELVRRGSAVTGRARRCWARRSAGPLDERVRDRIVAETRGNPLALLELPRGLTPAELAGGFGLPDALPLSGRIEESFRRRLEPLPAGDAAAAAGRGGRAGRRPGAGVARRRAARRSGSRPRRRRPRPGCSSSARACGSGIRWCARRSTGPRRRTSGASVHRALAEATDPEVDPDRRAWHRAQAAAGPDEDVAASSSARPAARRRAAGWPRRPPSSSGPPS